MSTVQPGTHGKVLGIFCSDLHFQLSVPPWRSNEPDWMEAQARPIREIAQLQEKHNCDIFCSGDITEKWNSSPELINWIMEHLPYMHAIPGQHDLPNHNIKEKHRSAYRTLARASIINDLKEPRSFANGKLRVWPFPFGTEIKPLPHIKEDRRLDVALCHEYNWVPGHSYENAPPEQDMNNRKRWKRFVGYNAVFCGDNHNAFTMVNGKTRFINCGTTIRRLSSERDYHPCVWLLYEDGFIDPHNLDIIKDKHLKIAEDQYIEERMRLDLSSFIKELNHLGFSGLDFESALTEYCRRHSIPAEVYQIIVEAIPHEQA